MTKNKHNRGFKPVKDSMLSTWFYKLEKEDVILPQRSTKNAAGYDFFIQQDIIISAGDTYLIPTGVKAYMQSDEVLQVYDRSSNPIKKGIVLLNSVGIIDSDYYENETTDGMIYGLFQNITNKNVVLSRGDAFMQGVFTKYLTTDDDVVTETRTGGLGSTGN